MNKKVPGLTLDETERLAKYEVLVMRGLATHEDLKHYNWLRAKIDKRKVPFEDDDDTVWLTREGAQQLGRDTIRAFEQSGQEVRYLEDIDDED